MRPFLIIHISAHLNTYEWVCAVALVIHMNAIACGTWRIHTMTHEYAWYDLPAPSGPASVKISLCTFAQSNLVRCDCVGTLCILADLNEMSEVLWLELNESTLSTLAHLNEQEIIEPSVVTCSDFEYLGSFKWNEPRVVTRVTSETM